MDDQRITIEQLATEFITAKSARGLSRRTIKFYREKVAPFIACHKGEYVANLTPQDIRQWILDLETQGHNPGGVSAHYRSLKVMLLWYEDEYEPTAWRNPIRKVPAPRVPDNILEPIDLATVSEMINTCGKDKHGRRDYAIMLTLLDTGMRASELTGLDLADLSLPQSEIVIRQGKGGKTRTVFLRERTRRAIRQYLNFRGDSAGALFLSRFGTRLDYHGLRSLLRRRGELAHLAFTPQLHAFRRAFAINFIREGGDILSLQKLLGHADLSVIKRYVKLTAADLRATHARLSLVDRL